MAFVRFNVRLLNKPGEAVLEGEHVYFLRCVERRNRRAAPMRREPYNEAASTFWLERRTSCSGVAGKGKVSLGASIVDRHADRDHRQ